MEGWRLFCHWLGPGRFSRWLSLVSAPIIIAPALPLPFFLSIHTLIIASEMLFAVTSTEFTTPSTAFAYLLIWTFPIEAVPQLLMACVLQGCYSPPPLPSPPSRQQCPDKNDEVNSWPPDWLVPAYCHFLHISGGFSANCRTCPCTTSVSWIWKINEHN